MIYSKIKRNKTFYKPRNIIPDIYLYNQPTTKKDVEWYNSQNLRKKVQRTASTNQVQPLINQNRRSVRKNNRRSHSNSPNTSVTSTATSNVSYVFSMVEKFENQASQHQKHQNLDSSKSVDQLSLNDIHLQDVQDTTDTCANISSENLSLQIPTSPTQHPLTGKKRRRRGRQTLTRFHSNFTSIQRDFYIKKLDRKNTYNLYPTGSLNWLKDEKYSSNADIKYLCNYEELSKNTASDVNLLTTKQRKSSKSCNLSVDDPDITLTDQDDLTQTQQDQKKLQVKTQKLTPNWDFSNFSSHKRSKSEVRMDQSEMGNSPDFLFPRTNPDQLKKEKIRVKYHKISKSTLQISTNATKYLKNSKTLKSPKSPKISDKTGNFLSPSRVNSNVSGKTVQNSRLSFTRTTTNVDQFKPIEIADNLTLLA